MAIVGHAIGTIDSRLLYPWVHRQMWCISNVILNEFSSSPANDGTSSTIRNIWKLYM